MRGGWRTPAANRRGPNSGPLFAGALVIGLALALIVTPGLAEKSKPTEAKPAEYTQYFTGQSKVMPPDGKRAYGPPRQMLVKRVVSPEKNQIRESVIVGPERFEVTLTRIEQTSKFKLTAKPARYEGTITFSGKAWHWSSWTYEISFHRQGKLTGTGQLKAGKMTTNKAFFGPDGK